MGLDACSSWSNPAARHRGSAGTDPVAVASLLLAFQRLPWNVLEGLSKQPWGIIAAFCVVHLSPFFQNLQPCDAFPVLAVQGGGPDRVSAAL